MTDNLNQTNNTLEVRMYFFVPYNISDIQKGIQAGHAALRYCRIYAEKNPEVWDFIDDHETWIILDGGTTNNKRDFDGVALGTLNQIADELLDNDINFSYFIEPDLNGALSSVCFLCDERVFNSRDYPSFIEWLIDIREVEKSVEGKRELYAQSEEQLKETYSDEYRTWIRLIGGIKNEFLRKLIKDKKLA